MTEAKRSFGSETERVVNGRVFKVTEVPQEDPEDVRRRDRVKDNVSGKKPMVKSRFGRMGLKVTLDYWSDQNRNN